MSYNTLEVELVNGRVVPRHAEVLPEHASALLTILAEKASVPGAGEQRTLGQLMSDLVGTGKGKLSDLSTNKDHLADLGR